MSADNPYSLTEQWLHRLALGSNSRLELAFALEKQLFGSRLTEDSGDHLFVCGLARAGTTLLMRLLFATGQFCSLTYRDMPFVLSPNLWAMLSGRGQQASELRERAHGDGMLVGFDSPEALEEVFWRVFCGDEYIRSDHLAAMTATDAVIDDFHAYVRLILFRYRGSRYLSKNNNNVLRIPVLRQAFPRARILVPFRHPLAQAQSLLEQHLLFTSTQEREPFVRHYMDWLVHHEFGHGHRPVVSVSDAATATQTDLRYWLDNWLRTYRWLLAQHGEDSHVHFVCYDRLCADPDGYWRQLADMLGVAGDLPGELPISPRAVPQSVEGFPSLAPEVDAVFQALRLRSC